MLSYKRKNKNVKEAEGVVFIKLAGRQTFIVKPNDLSQGKGIFLNRSLEVIEAACKEEDIITC